MEGTPNGIRMILDSDNKTKLKITRSSQMLKKELNNINKEQSKALSKINRCMEEAKHSLRSWRIQNESSQSLPQKRILRPVRQSNRASSGLHGTSCSSGARKETSIPPGFTQPQLVVDKGQGDGLAKDITEQNPDIECLGNACRSFESSTGDATDTRNQDEELETKEDERILSGAEDPKFGNQIETKEKKPNHALVELGTSCSKNSRLLGRRASTSNILFPASSRADLVLKKTEVNTISARMNRVRKLSDETSRAFPSSSCGAVIPSASGRARRSSVAVMTTSGTSLFDSLLLQQLQSKPSLARSPSDPSLCPEISPRYNLSLERSSNGRERKQLASEEAAVHESLLKIGRRMVAPMTGAQLEGKLRGRRHSVQYPLVLPPAMTERARTTSTSESDLYSELENCRYLRKPSK